MHFYSYEKHNKNTKQNNKININNDARPPLICQLYNYIISILNVCRRHGGAI